MLSKETLHYSPYRGPSNSPFLCPFSICLPMDIGDALALSYLVALLLVNGLAFFVITACYASMYCSISRHDATAPHSDLTVAKRMALLVFTDFACWAPIAFFG